MFRDDLERSGFAEGSSVGASVDVLWSIPKFNVTGYGAAKGSPSVVGNMLFCGTDTGRFLAARIDTGEVLWQVRLIPTSHGIHGSPAIVGGVVYIGAYDGTVYAFERATGLLLWRYKLGYQVGSSPAVVPEWGIVYSAHEESPNGGGFVVALDARTGRELWRLHTVAHPHSSVAVDVAREVVFVGDNRGVLYALDAKSGHERWTRELDGVDGKADIKTTPMVIAERGIVVFGAWSGKVYALDEATGETAWEHETGGRIMASTAYLPNEQTIFAGSPTGSLFAIDGATGATKWTFQTGARIMSSPAVSGEGRAVVFGASDGNVYAVRTDTGEKLWSVHVGGNVTGSPALVGDRVYVTSHRGGLWALRTHD
jgi:outer membrane protein assembly factor BamB